MTDRKFAIVKTSNMGCGFVRSYLCRIGSQYRFDAVGNPNNSNVVRFTRRKDAEYDRKQYGYAAASNIRVEKIA